jgi:hypothetical protein
LLGGGSCPLQTNSQIISQSLQEINKCSQNVAKLSTPKSRQETKAAFMLQTNSKLTTGLWWMRRGYWLLPVQENTKHTYAGFGVHRNKIKTSAQAGEWFGLDSRCNLAVVGWGGTIILDFDDIEVYNLWVAACPQEAQSYTEITPRGGRHVFMFGPAELEAGRVLIPGVEIKQTVLVAPSTIDGKPYTPGVNDIFEVDPHKIFFPLSNPAPAPSPQRAATPPPVAGAGLVSAIKAKINPVEILTQARPQIKLVGLGKRWVTCTCPFHDDKAPSFWIDTQRGLWGCHACNIHGDVINLWARFQGLTVAQAVQDLAGKVVTW